MRDSTDDRSFTQLEPLRLAGTQSPKRLQRKVGGVNSARGDQCLCAVEHNAGVGDIADGRCGARVRSSQRRVADLTDKMAREPRMELTPDMGGDQLIDRVLHKIVAEIQLGAS